MMKMKRRSSLLLLLLLNVAFLALVADAQVPKEEPKSALLYRISGKGLKKPSYLFGTIHLICQKDMFPAETIKSLIAQTGQVILEIDLDDPEVLQKAAKGSVMVDGKSLKDQLKPEEFAKLDELFKAYLGIPFAPFQSLRPALISTILLRSPKVMGCPGPAAYDSFLVENAAANNLPIIGLENVEAEFAALDSQPLAKQIESLNKFAATPEKNFGDFKNMYQIYLKQDSDALYKFATKDSDADGLSPEKLLVERNLAWIPVIEKNISAAPSFIGVGGGHLGGEKGVVELLRKQGYILTPIRL